MIATSWLRTHFVSVYVEHPIFGAMGGAAAYSDDRYSSRYSCTRRGAIHFTIEIVDTAEEAEATPLSQLIMHEIHRAAVVDGLWYYSQ